MYQLVEFRVFFQLELHFQEFEDVWNLRLRLFFLVQLLDAEVAEKLGHWLQMLVMHHDHFYVLLHYRLNLVNFLEIDIRCRLIV